MNTYNQKQAAALIGVSPRHFAKLVKKHRIKPVDEYKFGRGYLRNFAAPDVLGLKAKYKKDTIIAPVAPPVAQAGDDTWPIILERVHAVCTHQKLLGEKMASISTKQDLTDASIRRLEEAIKRLLKAAGLPVTTQ